MGKLLIFDYATQYRLAHSSIPAAKTFALSDADYNDFEKYLSKKDYTYSNPSEKVLKELQLTATKDQEFPEIKTEFEALKAKLAAAKADDLQQHKVEIKQVLENEIVSRYYYDKGRYESNFKYDREVAQAVKTMQDKAMLASILKGEGSYKIIGKPSLVMAAAKAESKNDN